MLRTLRPFARLAATPGPLTRLVRWTLAVFVSFAVLAPGAFAGLVCGMDSDGSGCPRCAAQLAAEPTPPCHAKADVKPTAGACHEKGTTKECCGLQERELPFALPSLSPAQHSTVVAHGDWGTAATWLDPEMPPRTAPVACESPPGSTGLLVAQTTILRL